MTAYAVWIFFMGLLPTAVLFALARMEGARDYASPLAVAGWVFLIGYSLKSVYLSFAVPLGIPYRTSEFTAQSLELGQLMACLGVFGFILGYLTLNRVTILGTRRLGVVVAPARVFFWPIMAVSILAVAYAFYLKGLHIQLMSLNFVATKFFVNEETGVRSSLGFLTLGADFLIVGTLYAVLIAKDRPSLYVFYPALALVILYFFLSSQRTAIIMIIVAFLLARRSSVFQIKSKRNIRLLAVVAVLMLGLSLASTIRDNRQGIGLSEISVVDGVGSTLNHVFYGLYAIDPAKLSGMAIRHDEYLLGESFLMFVVAPIPRTLWPDKPNVRLGPYIAQDILDYRNRSGAPPSAIGEFYVNFGWLGVGIGMFLVGAGAAIARSLYKVAPDPDVGRLRYTFAMMAMIYFLIGDFTYAAVITAKLMVAAVLAESYYVLRRRRSSVNQDLKVAAPSNVSV